MPDDLRPTPLYHLYSGASTLLAPFAWRKVARRLGDYGISHERQRERLGQATLNRPEGPLIWFHAASVGESLSVLTLITRLGDMHPKAEFLITSGTPTSAELIAKRMPPRSRHQFPPLDSRSAVNRFLQHWQPNLGVFVESELWPQMVVRASATGCPLVLLNARMSDRTVNAWAKRPATARFILSQFDLFLTQNQKTADNLRRIRAAPDRIRPGSNLKAVSAPLPVDQTALKDLQSALGDRPLWVASSTHAGEEETVLCAHAQILKSHPDACLLLAPRHPERGDTVEALIHDAGFSLARRSRKDALAADTQVYLADTLGEVGTWYALCPRVFMGGSLKNIGGHNPFEPAQLGATVLTGPGCFNFAESYAEMIRAGAAREVSTAEAIAAQIITWLETPRELELACAAATAYIARQSDHLDKTAAALIDLLPAG